MQCFLNGRLQDQQQASIPISDRGFLYGDSVFETLRILSGRPLWLAAHLERLERGMELLGFESKPTRSAIESACHQVISANAASDGVLRIMVTRGSGARGANPMGTHSPTLLITQSALPARLEQQRQRGYQLIISEWRKPSRLALPNQAKLGNYLNSILAMREAAQRGADEAVLLDDAGHVVECSQANLFFVRDDTLLTAELASGALHGITRSVLLELAQEIGVQYQECVLSPEVIAQATESFVTNSLIGIMPVARIEAHQYQLPGKLTQQLQAQWSRAQLYA